MPDPTQFDPDPIRVALDHGEVWSWMAARCVGRRGIAECGAAAGALACLVGGPGTAGVVVGVADLPPHDSAALRRAGPVTDTRDGRCGAWRSGRADHAVPSRLTRYP